MSEIDEATSGEVSPDIVEVSRAAAVKSLLRLPHKTERGTLEVNGVTKSYKFTRPLPRAGDPRGDAIIQFEGVLEIEGKPPMPWSMVRLSHDDGRTETSISVNGSKARVVREPLPQSVVYEGKVEMQLPTTFDYRVEQTIRRGEAALTRDELEALITAHNAS